jgi:hypothetical protein
VSGGFNRRLDRVEQQLRGLLPAEGDVGRPSFEEAGRVIAAAFLDGAPPPAWLTADVWQRLAGHMRRLEDVYDQLVPNAARFDGQRCNEVCDESSQPGEGNYTDEVF